jgi:hypothetical protein
MPIQHAIWRVGDDPAPLLDEDELNQSHQIVLVASELDASTERIVGYLNERDIAINVVFFQVFESGSESLLSRAWLIDPGETQANVAASSTVKGPKEPWNGELCVVWRCRLAQLGRCPEVRLCQRRWR